MRLSTDTAGAERDGPLGSWISAIRVVITAGNYGKERSGIYWGRGVKTSGKSNSSGGRGDGKG